MFKSLLIFVGGLVIGAFGYEALMKDTHQQKIIGIITEGELHQIENFLAVKNANDEIRYCLLYNAARYNTYVLQQKIESTENSTFTNWFLLSNMENAKKAIREFTSLENENLEYACENT